MILRHAHWYGKPVMHRPLAEQYPQPLVCPQAELWPSNLRDSRSRKGITPRKFVRSPCKPHSQSRLLIPMYTRHRWPLPISPQPRPTHPAACLRQKSVSWIPILKLPVQNLDAKAGMHVAWNPYPEPYCSPGGTLNKNPTVFISNECVPVNPLVTVERLK